ncbi:hypothetical protein XPR_3293 [Xanthomonas arboricola pv. pruni MAFF 301420]|uniref:Uncharacterized protein n=5 Tax=Xanthomonas arboricola TaxID=56448 RepID=W4SKG3_9XANT|nr:hypothetical protein XPR_3293 [Xanthomonas arboricola pv. pruni MAFF 301420]
MGAHIMQLVFVKGFAKHDRMDVIRDGLLAESIDCPKQGIIPHDMVHYAVESTLHKRGFICRVFDGEAASFQMESQSESDGVERLVEVFQADGWSGWSSTPLDMLDLYQVTCNASQCEPLAVQAGDIEAVRKRIFELTTQWQSVPMGGSLALQFEHSQDAV